MIRPELISEFRNYVNSNEWTLFAYKNVDNRNQWNCICSAMDWIEVSAIYLSKHPLSGVTSDMSIEVFSYIACVDIIVEAIEQLHRVIYKTNERVFDQDNDCFPENLFQQNDREYFKNIRACFGAHPVNLHDPEEPDNKYAKRFASWSGGGIGKGDFSVVLYSNKVGGNNIILGIEFAQLAAFADKYYSHLTQIKNELNSQYEEFCSRKRNEKFSCIGDPLARLRILKEESSVRLDNDYYRISIDELIRTLETPITCEANKALVDRYYNHLETVIDEIHENLQTMNFKDLKDDTVDFSAKQIPLPNGWVYWVEKLNDARLGLGYHEIVWGRRIRELFEGWFVFQYESNQELYVLVQAALYAMSCSE